MKRSMLLASLALTMSVGLAPASSWAAINADEVSPATFTTQALNDSAAAQALARMALQRSKSSDVRAYAQEVLTDTQSEDKSLSVLATQNSVAPTGHLSDVDRGDLETLRTISRGEFDKFYTDIASRYEQRAYSLYSTAMQSANPAVAQYAKATAPVLNDHWTDARELHSEVADDSYAHSFG